MHYFKIWKYYQDSFSAYNYSYLSLDKRIAHFVLLKFKSFFPVGEEKLGMQNSENLGYLFNLTGISWHKIEKYFTISMNFSSKTNKPILSFKLVKLTLICSNNQDLVHWAFSSLFASKFILGKHDLSYFWYTSKTDAWQQILCFIAPSNSRVAVPSIRISCSLSLFGVLVGIFWMLNAVVLAKVPLINSPYSLFSQNAPSIQSLFTSIFFPETLSHFSFSKHVYRHREKRIRQDILKHSHGIFWNFNMVYSETLSHFLNLKCYWVLEINIMLGASTLICNMQAPHFISIVFSSSVQGM